MTGEPRTLVPDPAASAALLAKARRFAQDHHLTEALEAARAAAGKDPSNTEAYAYWGVSAAELGLFADALEPLQIASDRLPPGTMGWANVTSQLARALSNAGFRAGAFRTAMALDRMPPPDPIIRHRLGAALARIGLVERALPHLEWAARMAPDKAELLFELGVAYLSLGRAEEAEGLLERSIARDPIWPQPHMALSSLKRWSAEENHVARLAGLQADPRMGPSERAELGFSLFKELDDLGRREEAWPILVKANEDARGLEPAWSSQEDAALVDALIERFPQALFASARTTDSIVGDSMPIFVLGLPRSGTTLVERILAAHPAVASIGEAPAFPMVFRSASRAPVRRELKPDVVRDTAGADWTWVARQYLIDALFAGPTARFTVDKLPLNSLLIGAIRLVFPRAPIVLLRRDPMDTLFSNYRVQFTGIYRWTYRLGDMAAHYAHHLRLMEHWRACLGGSLIEVRYEDLVSDPRPNVERLLAACGLDFDERCLSPHEAEGGVRTASIVQVRRPISAASVGGWRRYAQDLEPLRARLEALGALRA